MKRKKVSHTILIMHLNTSLTCKRNLVTSLKRYYKLATSLKQSRRELYSNAPHMNSVVNLITCYD